jgi:cytosine/adenosine deaminase-related metal-dependent hydrolase
MPPRLPCLLSAPPAAEGRLWLTNATLFDGTGAPAHDAAAVLVEHGRIARVGRASDPVPDGAREVDLDGRTLMPGLIDAHAHAYGTMPQPPLGTEPIRPGTEGHFLAAALRDALRGVLRRPGLRGAPIDALRRLTRAAAADLRAHRLCDQPGRQVL